jgi:hypothetical protein
VQRRGQPPIRHRDHGPAAGLPLGRNPTCLQLPRAVPGARDDLVLSRMGYGAMQLAAADLVLPADTIAELDAISPARHLVS